MCEILNQVFWNVKITSRQKHGVVISLPKPSVTQKPADVRPIRLLNSEYKILARLAARSLRPVLEEHLANTQFCGIPENKILDAVATVRDYIAYAENRKIQLYVLSLDIKNAFDGISHE
jgi:hypothetical protein